MGFLMECQNTTKNLKINKNKTIFRKEKECFKRNKYFNALSLISIMLIDLGIITEVKYKLYFINKKTQA